MQGHMASRPHFDAGGRVNIPETREQIASEIGRLTSGCQRLAGEELVKQKRKIGKLRSIQ